MSNFIEVGFAISGVAEIDPKELEQYGYLDDGDVDQGAFDYLLDNLDLSQVTNDWELDSVEIL